VLVAVELAEEGVGRGQRRAQVAVGLVRLGGTAFVDGRRALDDVLEALALRLAQRVEELVEVDRRRRVRVGDHGAVVQRGRVVGTRRQRHVAVRDPRQGGGADHRRGSLVQGAIEADPHLGAAVVGELDRVDRADRLASDQDLVPVDELAPGLEQELVADPFAAASEDDQGDGDDGERECAERDRPATRSGWRRRSTRSHPGSGS
jgi:hypothetical protein